jgi:hypothetical protein
MSVTVVAGVALRRNVVQRRGDDSLAPRSEDGVTTELVPARRQRYWRVCGR